MGGVCHLVHLGTDIPRLHCDAFGQDHRSTGTHHRRRWVRQKQACRGCGSPRSLWPRGLLRRPEAANSQAPLQELRCSLALSFLHARAPANPERHDTDPIRASFRSPSRTRLASIQGRKRRREWLHYGSVAAVPSPRVQRPRQSLIHATRYEEFGILPRRRWSSALRVSIFDRLGFHLQFPASGACCQPVSEVRVQ